MHPRHLAMYPNICFLMVCKIEFQRVHYLSSSEEPNISLTITHNESSIHELIVVISAEDYWSLLIRLRKRRTYSRDVMLSNNSDVSEEDPHYEIECESEKVVE